MGDYSTEATEYTATMLDLCSISQRSARPNALPHHQRPKTASCLRYKHLQVAPANPRVWFVIAHIDVGDITADQSNV